MEAHEIAVFIKNFNVVTTTALTIFAVFGIVALVGGKSRLNIFRNRVFLRAYCVAALAAFALEVTAFNFPHYLKYFAGPELFTTEVSAEAPDRLLTSEAGYSAEIVVDTRDGNSAVSSGLRFKNLDRRVTSVFCELEFSSGAVAEMRVRWRDEESSREYTKKVYRDMPHENYAPLQPCGKVEELEVMFNGINSGTNLNVVQVVLNRPIPFWFSGLRLLAVSFLLFAALVFFRKGLRAKAAYDLFERKFDPASWKQNLAYALSVVALIFFSLACVLTSVEKAHSLAPGSQQYNRFLVDALLDGRTYLDWGNPEKLLNAERPYDTRWLSANGYERDVDWMWDWVWYEGKHYCYFGVVPAVALFIPYKLVTGAYLSNAAGVFTFVSVAVVLLAALWRHCVKRYMPDMRFAFYLLSFMTLFFASGLTAVVRQPSVYTIVQSAGLMFAVAGILLLLQAVEKERVNRLKLFFACLCFALIAGCRPNMIFVSILVPVLLWKRRSWKLLPPVLIPCLLVAIPLCVYNYARFDSIFEFGQRYVLTSVNSQAYSSLNPIATAVRMFVAPVKFLFTPVVYTLTFPYVEHFPRASWVVLGGVQYSDSGAGMVCFPVTFCLFWLLAGRERPKAFPLLTALLGAACAVILLNSWVVGFVGRFTVDFAAFVILPSLFCAHYWCNNCAAGLLKTRLAAAYALLAVSVFTGMFLFVSGLSLHPYGDPVLYRYLETSLGLIRYS